MLSIQIVYIHIPLDTSTTNTVNTQPCASAVINHPGLSPHMQSPAATNIQHSEFSIADLGLRASDSLLPSTSSHQASSAVPAIPKSAIDKIRSGEFVNFDSLLPNHSPVAHDEYTFKVIGGSSPSVSLVPKNQNKPKVTNFNLWMVSWTNFFRTYIIFWPHRVSELVRYQATICDFANQFTFAAWSGYDRMFRYRMATDQSLSWSRVDDDLYNRYLRGASLQTLCYVCRNFGHLANTCPLRTGYSASGSDSLQPFGAPSIQRRLQAGLHPLLPVQVELLPGSLHQAGRGGQRPAISSTTVNASIQDVGTLTCVESVLAPTPLLGVSGDSLCGSFAPLPSGIVSPINVDRLAFLLRNHPRPDIVSYVVSGFSFGFDIGFCGEVSLTRPRNLLSARRHPEPVSVAIAKEVTRGHTSGPFVLPPLEPFHCSPLGAVPKKDGTFRIILDLSSPRGASINEGISRDDFSIKYSSFDDAVTLVRSLGSSAFMAKLDIRHAFRFCPVRRDQWGLLGYCWQNQFYVDTRLPFGSRSSPYIFNTFADLLLWILIYVGGIQFVIHYLDDFFLCASSQLECHRHMDTVTSLFSELGVPVADDKTCGPAQVVSYLGIEIDALAQEIRLPADKYHELLLLLRQWQGRKKCTKRELLSLIGSLSFASKVVKPGHMFMRRLIDLSTSVSLLHHHLTLTLEKAKLILSGGWISCPIGMVLVLFRQNQSPLPLCRYTQMRLVSVSGLCLASLGFRQSGLRLWLTITLTLRSFLQLWQLCVHGVKPGVINKCCSSLTTWLSPRFGSLGHLVIVTSCV